MNTTGGNNDTEHIIDNFKLKINNIINSYKNMYGGNN